MAADEQQDPIVVGQIQAPYGIKGWVHVAAFTEPSDNLLHYRPLLVSGHRNSPAGRNQATDWRPLEIAEIRPHKQGFVARVSGITDRTAAERMKGNWLGVMATALPDPGIDEYYWRDLIGAAVVGQDGQEFGLVADLIETGADDVLVIKRGSDATDLLIPFHRQYVLDVDLSAAKILVDWAAEAE